MTRRIPVAAFLLLTACGGPVAPEGGEMRLVSLVPSTTELIYAMGAGRFLVGNTDFCDWPEEARRVVKVGSFHQPDLERIVALRPDVVFIARPIHRPVAEKLQELGVRTHASDPQVLAELFAEIGAIGRVVGRQAEADSLVRTLQHRLDALPGWPDTPRVYVEISPSPMTSAGSGTFLNEVVHLAGGRNIFDHLSRQYPVVDAEAVVALDPEIILLVYPGSSPADVAARLGWAGVSAVRTRSIIADIDENLLVRPGPRVMDGIEQLALRLRSQFR